MAAKHDKPRYGLAFVATVLAILFILWLGWVDYQYQKNYEPPLYKVEYVDGLKASVDGKVVDNPYGDSLEVGEMVEVVKGGTGYAPTYTVRRAE